MNPLLDRLHKQKPKPHSIQLIPKLRNTPHTILDPSHNRLKTILNKTNHIKLPALSEHYIKNAQSSLDSTLKLRKQSCKIYDESMYFPTQVNYQKETISKLQVKRKDSFIWKPQIKQEYKKDEEQVFQYLKILEDNQDLEEQFCYMNRGNLPYSYYIVNYQERNKKEYITVSLRGITLFKNDQMQFMTVKCLRKEIQNYKTIKQITFFKQYLIQKTFKHWLIKTLKRKFDQKCKFITANLFSQNTILQKYFAQLFSTVQQINKPKLLYINIIQTQTIPSLKQLFTNQYNKVNADLNYFENHVYQHLQKTIRLSLLRFRQQKRVTLGKKDSDQPFIPFDSKKKNMKFTQLAKLKQFECYMFKLIKYTDLVRFNLKISMVEQLLKSYRSMLDQIYQNYQKKQNLTFVSWLNMVINLDTNKKQLKCVPTLQQIVKCFDTHKSSIIFNILNNHTLIIQRKLDFQLQNYQISKQDKNNRLDLKYFVEKHPNIILLQDLANKSLKKLTNLVEQYIETEGKNILQMSIQNNYIQNQMSNQWIKNELLKIKNNLKYLQTLSQQIELGLIVINIQNPIKIAKNLQQQKFKQTLANVPKQINKRCQNIKIQTLFIDQQITKISKKIKTQQQYIQQINNIENLNQKRINIQISLQNLVDLQKIVSINQKQKIQILECFNLYEKLNKKNKDLEQQFIKNGFL